MCKCIYNSNNGIDIGNKGRKGSIQSHIFIDLWIHSNFIYDTVHRIFTGSIANTTERIHNWTDGILCGTNNTVIWCRICS